jgi:hypothetical protein
MKLIILLMIIFSSQTWAKKLLVEDVGSFEITVDTGLETDVHVFLDGDIYRKRAGKTVISDMEIKAKLNSLEAKNMQDWYANIRNRKIDRRSGQVRDLNNKLTHCLIGIFPRSQRISGQDLIFKIAINDMNDCH